MGTGTASGRIRLGHGVPQRPESPAATARDTSLDGDGRVFAVAAGVVALHLIVDGALADGALRRALEPATALVAAPALVMLYARGRRVVRAALAAVLGLAAVACGVGVYAPRIVIAGTRGTAAFTGLGAALAGLVLTALALRVALRGRRLSVRLLAIPALFVVLQWLLVPALNAGVATNAPRTPVASADTLGLAGARDVTFAAHDGVRLRGWYVPGSNGAAVIVLHGSHGDRGDTLAHLRLLARRGYAVLAYDARGHGESDGVTNALGWDSDDDVSGAVAFLRRQTGVDPGRIAALGLSLGGEVALRAAADGVPLAAVVADGAGASTLGDGRLLDRRVTTPLYVSSTWLTMRGVETLTGEREPPPLASVVGRIRVPVLLVASNRSGELELDRIYRARIGTGASLWYVGDAPHTRALAAHPAAYAARVDGFLDNAAR